MTKRTTLLRSLVGYTAMVAMAACIMAPDESTDEWDEEVDVSDDAAAAASGSASASASASASQSVTYCDSNCKQVNPCPNANYSCQTKNSVCGCYPN